MKKFRDGFIGPVIILFAICSLITLAVAATNMVTEPIIEEMLIRKTNETCAVLLPQGDAFTSLPVTEMPSGVTEVYQADNGAGYVIKSQAAGFDGQVVWMVGVDDSGKITGISMFDHSETSGYGTRVGEADYLAQYEGTNDPDSVAVVSGATRTSTSLKNALAQALEAYDLLA